jgi:hypothetical protein
VIVPSQSGLSVAALARPKFLSMVRIAITVEAFEAIASTLPLGSVTFKNYASVIIADVTSTSGD